MKYAAYPTRGNIWLFGILPPVILNLGAILLFGTYYALVATKPSTVQGISPSQVPFSAYVFVFLLEWVFALMFIARMGRLSIPFRMLLAAQHATGDAA